MHPPLTSAASLTPARSLRREGDRREGEGNKVGNDEHAASRVTAEVGGTVHRDQVRETVKRVNEALEVFDATALRLSYDSERELVRIQVVKMPDKAGEQERVIRQIPPEELLRLADTLEELRGVLFDRQV